MTGRLTISPLRDAEVEAAVALWDEAGLLRPWNDPRADLALAMAKPGSDVLAGRFDATLVATAMVGHDGHRGWVYYVAVSQAQRGYGIGARMMAACEDWCRTRGIPKLQLMVRNDNEAARGFYERIDYTRSDAFVMAKVL